MTITAEARDRGKRLDTFLQEKLPDYSRSRLQSWIKEARIRIGDATAKPSHLLRGGEVISVEPAQAAPLEATPEDLPLTVVYEDADVIVVDKPAGMVVHAGAGHHEGTLVNALLHHFGRLSSVNGDLRPGIVHRLDRETSGLIVVARSDRAHQHLTRQFQDRTVKKTYLAAVHGRMKQPQGRITEPITRDPIRRTRMTCKLGTGRNALTEYRSLEEFGYFSYLEVTIGTGRTHQIRVHLSSLHHPIVGDRLYGAPASIPGYPKAERFLLHAHRLAFRHPVTNEWKEFESPLPEDFDDWLRCAKAIAQVH